MFILPKAVLGSCMVNRTPKAVLGTRIDFKQVYCVGSFVAGRTVISFDALAFRYSRPCRLLGLSEQRLTFSDYLRQEPGSALGLVDPVLDQAGRGDVVVLLAEFMGGT